MVVFLKHEDGVVWLWQDKKEGITQDITGAEIWQAALEQELPLETNAHTWEFRHDPTGRPRYRLGHLRDTGKAVWLNLRTETCGVLKPQVVIGEDPMVPQEIRSLAESLAAAPHPGPPAVDNRSETRSGFRPARVAVGLDGVSHYIEGWYEPACEGSAIYVESLDEGPQRRYWLWWDPKTGRLTEMMTQERYWRAVAQQVDLQEPETWRWHSDHDGPGGRGRWYLGQLEGTEKKVWLHPGMQTCGLSRPQLEYSWRFSGPGRFVPLHLDEESEPVPVPKAP